jgi:hypothetical protein
MSQCVLQCQGAAHAMPQQEHRLSGGFGPGDVDHLVDISHGVGKAVDHRRLAVGLAVAAMIHRMYRQPLGHQSLGHVPVTAAVLTEPVAQHHGAPRLGWRPALPIDAETLGPDEPELGMPHDWATFLALRRRG